MGSLGSKCSFCSARQTGLLEASAEYSLNDQYDTLNGTAEVENFQKEETMSHNNNTVNKNHTVLVTTEEIENDLFQDIAKDIWNENTFTLIIGDTSLNNITKSAIVPLQYRQELDKIAEAKTIGPFVSKIQSVSIIGRDNEIMKVELESGAQYLGTLETNNKVLQGIGILFWPDDTYYFGEWVNNQPHGYGLFSCADGREYTGEWDDGAAHGRGVFKSNSGILYYGQVKNDIKCGFGKEIFPDGSSYAGRFADGMKQGLGLFTCPDGSTYKGSWKFDKKNGYGKLDGEEKMYMGEWVDDEMHGIGERRLPDGRVYRGEHFKGEMRGFCEYEWLDGKIEHGFQNTGLQC